MLCPVTRYRSITKDNENYDGDVAEALKAAQRLVERRTDRFFEYRDENGDPIEREETLKMYGSGFVYPRAVPVRDVIAPIDAKVDGDSVWGASAGISSVASYGWYRYPSTYASGTLTYTGGYEPDEMPEEIVQIVAELAYIFLGAGKSESKIPAGATSVSVGDVSFSGKNLGGGVSSALPDHIYRSLLAWKRKGV